MKQFLKQYFQLKYIDPVVSLAWAHQYCTECPYMESSIYLDILGSDMTLLGLLGEEN